MNCEIVREQLPSYVDGGGSDLSVRRHLSRCEGCRDELAQLDTLRREMRGLAFAAAEPPAELLASLESIGNGSKPIEMVRGHVLRNRKAYLGGVAVLAGAAGAAVLLRRRAA